MPSNIEPWDLEFEEAAATPPWELEFDEGAQPPWELEFEEEPKATQPPSLEALEDVVSVKDLSIATESPIRVKFMQALKIEENGSKEGFKDGIWLQHTSPEGGLDTIGYGHKLRKGEDFSEGLTEEQATEVLRSDMEAATKKASKIEGFNSMEEKYQLVLTEIAFNRGSVSRTEWPSLIKAIEVKDDKAVEKQMMRTYTDADGQVIPLTRRVKAIARTLLK